MYKNHAHHLPTPGSGTDLATCCVLCSQNCGLRVDVRDNEIVAVRADAESPITHGYSCNKAYSIGRYAKHDQRVTHPLRKRKDGSFERVSWEVALGEIAQRLEAVRRISPKAIGLIGIGGQANHMDAAYGLSFLTGLGSRRWFSAFAQEKTQHFLIDQWMCAASPSAYLHADQTRADFLIVLGSNPRVSNRGHSANKALPEMGRDPSRTLVVIDPRVTESTRCADRHLRPRPGSDSYLLLAMAKVILDGNHHDQAFLEAHSVGLQQIRGALRGVDLDEMSRRCGIDRETITELARDYAKARRAAILMDLGAEHVPFSTLIAYLVRLLAALTGNLGRIGGNIFYQSFNPPDPRGLETRPTDRAVVSDIPGIRALGSFEMFSPSLFPEEVLCDDPDHIRACIVEGANPMLSCSETARWREAFASLELLVVIDPAFTETARLADYVLPTPVGYEKWEFSGFPKGFPQIATQVRPPILKGPDEALPEPEIYARLAEAMDLFGPPPPPLGALTKLGANGVTRAALFAAASVAAMVSRNRGRGRGVQSRVIFWLYRTLGQTLPDPALTAVWLICAKNALNRRDAVLRTLGAEWRYRDPFSITEELLRRILDNPQGVEIARLDPTRNLEQHVLHDDGRIRLAPVEMIGEIRRALASRPDGDPQFPLVLAAGLRTHWTANTIQRDPQWRKGKGPHCELHIGSEDAGALGIETGAALRLVTAAGAATLPARVDSNLQPGFVFVPNGFGMQVGAEDDPSKPVRTDGLNLNELVSADDRDPFTGCPHHKHVRCRVEAI